VSFRFDSFDGTDQVFPLRGGQPPIVLEADGMRHPRSARSSAQVLTRYEDLTHLVASARVLWIGARDSVYVLPRGNFARFDAPERLLDRLLARVGELPGGGEQLARMSRVDETSRNGNVPRATWTLMLACGLVYVVQLVAGFRVTLAGHYSPVLVEDGDVWRILTANLLHAQGWPVGYAHIALNLLALLALGTLVERPLGSARTACVMAAAGVGSMVTQGWFGNTMVVGVSGIVFGLAGAMLWLDYRRAEELPAFWRFPRRNLLVLLAINGLLGLIVPFIALAAHLGGLLVGAVAAAVVTGRILVKPPLWIQATCGLVVLATALSVSTAGMDAFAGGDTAARYAKRWARLPGISPAQLNDHAWMIATSRDPSREELEAALLLAERAVLETDRSEATILDTLAEVQFAMGMNDAAIETIDEAIVRDPEDSYYREQRRRFIGERDPDDRPDYVPPLFRSPREAPAAEPADSNSPGLTV